MTINEEFREIYFEDYYNMVGAFVYRIDDIEAIAQHLVSHYQSLRLEWLDRIHGLASIAIHWGDYDSVAELYNHVGVVLKRVAEIESDMMADMDVISD